MNNTLQPGALLRGGQYQIVKSLGQGSFGITYLAMRTSLNQKVCIKEFFMKDINFRGDDGTITGISDGSLAFKYARKFRQEAGNLSSLNHPNIVKVTDLFDENGTCYYVMEYIEGEDLNSYVSHHQCSEDEAVTIIKDIASALQYMHEEKHMLHLDMKPGNVMRRASDGHVFVIDFGLSKYYNEKGEPETSTIIGLGTSGYAPIEQANQNKNGEFRPTIDVYALGGTLYKLLTGETPPSTAELVADSNLLSHNLQKHNVSEKLTYAVVRAMEVISRTRTQSVAEFLAVLSVGQPASTNEETVVEEELRPAEETIAEYDYYDDYEDEEPLTSPKPKKRKKLKWVLCGIATILLIGIGVLAYEVEVEAPEIYKSEKMGAMSKLCEQVKTMKAGSPNGKCHGLIVQNCFIHNNEDINVTINLLLWNNDWNACLQEISSYFQKLGYWKVSNSYKVVDIACLFHPDKYPEYLSCGINVTVNDKTKGVSQTLKFYMHDGIVK